MATPKLQATKDYRLFIRSADNRPLDPAKHKRLRKSMEKNGFLPCYPIVCIRDRNKHLVIYDGQHRLAFAESLALAVYYVVLEQGFDIAQVNSTQEKWNTRNFAETYAAQGKVAYQEGLEFADRHCISTGIAFGLLAGTTSWTNVKNEYYGGTFRIRDKQWAEMVGTIYSAIVSKAPKLRNARLIEAAMAITRVKGFDVQRLIVGVDRCLDKLQPYSTRDAYLEMLEVIYNFGRKQLVGLKVAAIQAMRDRNFKHGKKPV